MKTEKEILEHIKNAERELVIIKIKYDNLSQIDAQSREGHNLLLNRYRLEGILSGLYWTIDMKRTLGK